jgi:hypothetical protein
VNRLNWAINGDDPALEVCWPRIAEHPVNKAMPEMQIASCGSFLENT